MSITQNPFVSFLLVLALCSPAIATEVSVDSPEGAAIAQGKIYILSMGEDSEFSNPALDGAIYEWEDGKPLAALSLSTEAALANPSSLVVNDGVFYVVDGASVLAIDVMGKLVWRTEIGKENTFLYDLIRKPDGNFLVTDFGNGTIYQINSETGKAELLSQLQQMTGLARLEYFGNDLLATTWGSDNKFDGTVYKIIERNGAFEVTIVATGFSSLEGIQQISDNSVLVGTWKGHIDYPNSNLFEIDMISGRTTPYTVAGETPSPADFSSEPGSGILVIPVLTENRVWISLVN